MARRTYTAEQKEAALTLYENEGPTAVQKQLGIPKATIAGWAKAAGTRTVRNENTREATEAAKVDNAARRAAIIQRLYGVAETTIDLLETPETYRTMARDEMGAERAYSPGFIPAQDRRNELTSIGIALDKATTLEKVDNDNGATGAKSMLDRLAEQLKEAPLAPPGPGPSGELQATALPEDQ